MDDLLIQEELIKRYLYLYENRELILAMCINRGIEKDKINNSILELENLKRKKLKIDKQLYDMIDELINYYKEQLLEEKYYLFKEVNSEIIECYEEFLFTDKDIENTDLYKHIEAVKNNDLFRENFLEVISSLEERRKSNMYLKNIPTFTVWKILTYVRNKNLDNQMVLDAINKYYNIDRYVMTGINFDSGYILFGSDIDSKENELETYPNYTIISGCTIGNHYSGIIFDYKGNEFEQEDEYFESENYNEFHNKAKESYKKSNFMELLANMDMLNENIKKIIYVKAMNKLNKRLIR